MAYATVEQLAAALRVAVGPKNADLLAQSLDAAAVEIDHYCDRPPDDLLPEDPPDPLAHMVNISRGLEWFKCNDAAFGAVGFADIGVLAAPANPFARHAATLTPLKVRFGIA